MHHSVSRTVATAAIWLSTAWVFVSGVFRANWNTYEAEILVVVVVVVICASAVAGTALVWRPERTPGPAPKSASVLDDELAHSGP